MKDEKYLNIDDKTELVNISLDKIIEINHLFQLLLIYSKCSNEKTFKKTIKLFKKQFKKKMKITHEKNIITIYQQILEQLNKIYEIVLLTIRLSNYIIYDDFLPYFVELGLIFSKLNENVN